MTENQQEEQINQNQENQQNLSKIKQKICTICFVLFGIGVFLMLNLNQVQSKTFIDDNNLHVGNIYEVFTNNDYEISYGLSTFNDFLEMKDEEKDDFIKNELKSLGFLVRDYHDKYNTSGIEAVMQPGKADDRNCILVMGRYSRNITSPLNTLNFNYTKFVEEFNSTIQQMNKEYERKENENEIKDETVKMTEQQLKQLQEIERINELIKMNRLQQKNVCNTLCYFLILAKRLSNVGWLGRNTMLVLLDDSTPIGRNDFFNEYTINPICGRLIGGFEIDIEPNPEGATAVHISVPSQMYMSNLDIYSAYTKMFEEFVSSRGMEIVKPYSKFSHDLYSDLLLHATFVRYADAAEGPKHNCDMLTIQTKFNETEKYQTRIVIPHRLMLTSFLSMIRSYNSLYQQVQYSSYFYFINSEYSYISFLIVIIILGCFIAPVLIFTLYAVAPQYLYDVLKYNVCTSELFIINNRNINIKTETSYLAPAKLVVLSFFFGIVTFIVYTILFKTDVVSISDVFTEDDFTIPQTTLLYVSQLVPFFIVLILAKFFPLQTLSQVQLTFGLSGFPNVLVGVVMIFVNIPFALFYEFLVAATSLIQILAFMMKPKLVKVAVIISLLTTPLGLSIIVQNLFTDISLLVNVPFLAFIFLVFYSPFSMVRLYCFRSYHEILKQMEYDEAMKEVEEKERLEKLRKEEEKKNEEEESEENDEDN